MARPIRNHLALAVLGCLSERPMHPYEISTTLRSRNKEGSIKLNYGSLYSVVESLQKHGMITARETTRAGRRPERTVYEITPAGEHELEDWLSELISKPVRDFTALEAGLSLMGYLPPDEVARLLDLRAVQLRIDQRAVNAELAEGRAMGLPDMFVVEGMYRAAVLAAELAFVTSLAEGLRDGSFGGVKLWRRLHELRDGGISWAEIVDDPVHHLGEEAAVLKVQPSD
jgi:DNA-binding PadR family transcriptional regulator